MEDEMNFIVDSAKENMDHAIAHLEKEKEKRRICK